MEPEHLAEELNDQDRVLVVFGYLGPLAIVSLLASRREFVKWHAKQGLTLFATLAVLYLVVIKPMYYFMDRFLWGFLSELFRAGAWMVGLGVLVTALLCVIRGLEGERFKIPILGDLADRM